MSVISEQVATVIQGTAVLCDTVIANNVNPNMISLQDLSVDDVYTTNIHVEQNCDYDELNIAMNFAGGNQNVLMGNVNPAPNLTTGINNVVVGAGAGGSLTTGFSNVLMGAGAGSEITTSIRNVALGTNALSAATVGDDNVAIGANSGGLSVGSNNVIVGVSAGRHVGGYNVVMGYQAVGQVETVGANNIIIGTQAGNNVSLGDYNILLGYQAQTGGTFNNTVALGTNCVAAQSNTIYIGNQITNPYTKMVLGQANGGGSASSLIPGSLGLGYNSDAAASAAGVLPGQLYFKNINVGPKHQSVLCICLA